MKAVALDVETSPIIPGLLAPPLAVLSYATEHDEGLVDRDSAAAWLRPHLQAALDGTCVIVGHNIAYDMAVLAAHDLSLLPLIFEAYRAERIYDTMLCEQLFDVARGQLRRGNYGLDKLAAKYLGVELEKDEWRLGYGKLLHVPLEQWPQGARDYALSDARATHRVFVEQWMLDTDGDSPVRWLVNAPAQTSYAFSIHLQCVWGIRTDADSVAALQSALEAERHLLVKHLIEVGLLAHSKTGWAKQQKELQRRMAALHGGTPPTTAKGNVRIDRATLTATGDPDLLAYAEYVANEKLLSTYIPVLRSGTKHPINASFRLVETGRRGATHNMQTPPKKPGVRECYVPRPGFVYCSCDYDSLELRALAQANLDLFGSSPLAELYQNDPQADPHTKFAAENFLGISYAEAMRRKAAGDPEVLKYRQAAKAYNFGLPGGLGIETFVTFAATQYGFILCREEAKRGKDKWLGTWLMRRFFEYITHRVDYYGWIALPRSHRVRGNLGFCDAANYLFQGVAADGACEAHFRVAQACYTDKASPLYGSRIVNFLHDELILEMPEHRASDAAAELSRVMNAAMAVYIPDIPITTSPALMRCWSKSAKSLYANGRLQVWQS